LLAEAVKRIEEMALAPAETAASMAGPAIEAGVWKLSSLVAVKVNADLLVVYSVMGRGVVLLKVNEIKLV